MNSLSKINHHIKESKYFKTGDKIIIGVSGGIDSVCLLYILNTLKYTLGIQIIIAHFNHKLRKESDNEERFVKKLGQTYNLSVESASWKNPPKMKTSIEESARNARHKFFTQLTRKYKTTKIILAHNKDDVAETVLMRIIRGTGTSGLRGILPIKKIGCLNIIRPLLNTSRFEIEKIVKNQNLTYKNDPTNKELIFTRNKIRLNLLPKLQKEYNPNISQALVNLSENSQIDYDYLFLTANKVFNKFAKITAKNTQVQFEFSKLKNKHPAIIRMILKITIATITKEERTLNFKNIVKIESLICDVKNSTKLDLPGNISVTKSLKNLTIQLKKPNFCVKH